MTPAIKLLKKLGVDHSVHAYEHDKASESYGLEAAQALQLPPQQVFKTLVVQSNEGNYAVGIVPVSGSLNLKAMAAAMGAKKVKMADKAQVESMSGYIVGGVSPIAQKKALPTVIDDTAFNFETIYVSAGKRGLDVALAPQSLQSICKATQADIAAC